MAASAAMLRRKAWSREMTMGIMGQPTQAERMTMELHSSCAAGHTLYFLPLTGILKAGTPKEALSRPVTEISTAWPPWAELQERERFLRSHRPECIPYYIISSVLLKALSRSDL